MTERLSLYLHIPFCTVKCSYCDFNSYAGLESLAPAYVEAMIGEMDLWRTAAAPYAVETIFFGGGTPSLLPLPKIKRITDAVAANFKVADDYELSLEANPGTIELPYLCGLLELGINRLSLGVQSFHDDELASLDRLHDAETARQAYRWAREAGFQRVNLDLIYGLAGQTMERWRGNLEEAISLGPDHLSLYALTVEEGTPLAHRIAAGRAPAPDDDLQAEMYEWTEDRLAREGYEHYEISNWALPGQRCRHNITYWENRPYLGFGAGAHSYFDRFRFANVYSPSQYVHKMGQCVESPPPTDVRGRLNKMKHVINAEEQTARQSLADTLIMGLRLREGVHLATLESRYGADCLASCRQAIEEFSAAGLLEEDGGRLRLTSRGRLLSSEVFVRLLPD